MVFLNLINLLYKTQFPYKHLIVCFMYFFSKEKKDLLVRTSCYNGNSDVKNIYLNQTIIELKQKVAELEKDKSTLQFKLEELQRKT